MIKFTTPQLIDMLSVQNRLNTMLYGPLWREQRYEWHRMAWLECAAITNHIGWKWWKGEKPDLAQAQLGAVTIWQSCLSYALEATHAQLQTDNPYVTADSIGNDMVLAETSLTYGFAAQVKLHGEIKALLNLIELLAGQCVSDQQVSPAITLELAEVLGLAPENLYHVYLARNLLPLFRDEYKKAHGVYRNKWYGQEDQEVLNGLLKDNRDWNSERVYAELREHYDRPTAKENAND